MENFPHLPMKSFKTQPKTSIDIEQIIKKARKAELSRNLEELKDILAPIWDNIDDTPDYSIFEPKVEADLLTIAGYFLSNYGHIKQLSDYQERGKDVLSKAINIYDELNLPHEITKAKIYLAVTYYYQGQIEESEIIFEEASALYKNDQLHPLNLMIWVTKIGSMLWRKEYQQCLNLYRQMEVPMEFCSDHFLLFRFHNQSGMLFGRLDKFNAASEHYEKALEYSNQLNNLTYTANVNNNLAFMHGRCGNLEKGKICAERAIKIIKSLEDVNLLSVALDTQAGIYLKEGNLKEALSTIDSSIKLFRKGEFYSGLTDALWVKTQILLMMNKKEKAFMEFVELSEIASKQIGKYAVKKYAKEFSKLVYVRKNKSFNEEVREFKREMLSETMLEANVDKDEAAKLLKISRKKLSTTINNQFPEICLDFGVPQSLMV